jgi:hypothetical protein
MKIKAIETQYAGRYFRSRLEARWAVFFDHMAIHWDYEIVGYSVGDVRYLPDFYLPEIDLHVEIKPRIIPLKEQIRLDKIKNQWTEKPFAIIKGEPSFDQYELFLSTGAENLRGPFVFSQCRRCNGISYNSETEWGNLGPHTCGNANERPPCDGGQIILAAYRTAMKSFRRVSA